MVDLTKLNVSLTKHGAHKIALLLQDYGKDELLARIRANDEDVRIDLAQARKNLSVGVDGNVPPVWDQVRELGLDAINALAFIAIVFSHHELIRAMQQGRSGKFRGRIVRGEVLDGKEYTNFAHTIEQLGFSVQHTRDEVTYDLARIFAVDGLAPLARDILVRKIEEAGWSGLTDPVEEMVASGFHEALAVAPATFSRWLRRGAANSQIADPKDAAFFSDVDAAAASAKTAGAEFTFRAGHRPRKTGSVPANLSTEERIARLRHNAIQTALYERLVKRFGKERVGTEHPTGMGTSIDVVVRFNKKHRLYEIKVAHSVRACLRQALPQLMEYAFWSCSDDLVKDLVVVGTAATTPEAEAYLDYLRSRFCIPISYEHFVL